MYLNDHETTVEIYDCVASAINQEWMKGRMDNVNNDPEKLD
jgi:hypothetical protein